MIGWPQEPEDATVLDPDEREGLIPSHITLRRELNELEQQNILEATSWALARRRDPVDEGFGRRLHRRMFGQVWQWAGAYRNSNKNIGVDRSEIQPRLHTVLDNVRYWRDHQTFPSDEIAVRFHHGLVAIHPFPNGNGRWSRLMADLLAIKLEEAPFTWGSSSLRSPDQMRRAYIGSLRMADDHDFAALLAFARS